MSRIFSVVMCAGLLALLAVTCTTSLDKGEVESATVIRVKSYPGVATDSSECKQLLGGRTLHDVVDGAGDVPTSWDFSIQPSVDGPYLEIDGPFDMRVDFWDIEGGQLFQSWNIRTGGRVFNMRYCLRIYQTDGVRATLPLNMYWDGNGAVGDPVSDDPD